MRFADHPVAGLEVRDGQERAGTVEGDRHRESLAPSLTPAGWGWRRGQRTVLGRAANEAPHEGAGSLT